MAWRLQPHFFGITNAWRISISIMERFFSLDALIIATAKIIPANCITTDSHYPSCQIVTNLFPAADPTVFSDLLLSF